MYMLQAIFPAVRVIQLGKWAQNLPLILAEVINDTTLVMEGIRVSFNSLVVEKL